MSETEQMDISDDSENENEDEHNTIRLSVYTRQGIYKSIVCTNVKFIGSGAFGMVYRARVSNTGEIVAVKRIPMDSTLNDQELQFMMNLEHSNIVELKYFFYSDGEEPTVYLNLVLEYFPETLEDTVTNYITLDRHMPIILVKVLMYQILRSLAYIHSLNICHRDVKPNNLLVHPITCVVKLCDFGFAKHLVVGQPNMPYICNTHFRAPELLFGASHYTTAVDVWSAGCVMGELLLKRYIFSGDTGMELLFDMIKLLGTPTRDQLVDLRFTLVDIQYPRKKSPSWQEVFGARAPSEGIQLISSLLEYSPSSRIRSLHACAHSFFDELRESNTRLPGGRVLPPLFNFTEQELNIEPSLNSKLIPKGVNEASNNLQDEAGSSHN